MMKRILTLMVGMWMGFAFGQVPYPAGPQQKPVLLLGGTAHLGNGRLVENAAIAFDKGILTHVAGADGFGDTAAYEVIDVKGQHVYPGFISPMTTLGLTEVSAVRATQDTSETGSLNPNIRSIIAYNTDSELIPTLRYNGILTAQIIPLGRLLSGTSSIVQLDAWNWEDAVFQVDDGIHLSWPPKFRRRFDFVTMSVKTNPNKNYDKIVASLEKLFQEAIAYGKAAEPKDTNLKLAAMQGLFTGSQRLYIQVDDGKLIMESVAFAQSHGVQKIVLAGAEDALLVKDFIKKHQIPIILDNLHRRPSTAEAGVDEPFSLPSQLQAEGMFFCLAYPGVMSSRNLAFVAGTAAAYGLTKEEALAAITLNTARILGIDDRLGSLEVGKQATLFVSSGDALDMRGNNLQHAFIQGRKIVLAGRQQALFERYQRKYGHGKNR